MDPAFFVRLGHRSQARVAFGWFWRAGAEPVALGEAFGVLADYDLFGVCHLRLATNVYHPTLGSKLISTQCVLISLDTTISGSPQMCVFRSWGPS